MTVRILVIGGTQFIGRHLMSQLLKNKKKYDVTVLNRGKTPWPFEKNCCKKLTCDRLNDRERFRESIKRSKDFDVVVDFVAFSVENVRDVIISTRKSCHYIFISTDSVYMACMPPKIEGSALRENDATHAVKRLPRELRKIRGSYQIQYGSNKLQAEEYLRDKATGRYTCLRFPDVFGPHDNQDGFINTLQKIKSGDSIGRLISRDTPQTQKSHSFVFVKDAISAIMSSIEVGPISTSLNVCHDEHIKWTRFVEIMAASLTPSVSTLRWDVRFFFFQNSR